LELQNDHSILAEAADEQRDALIMPADDATIWAAMDEKALTCSRFKPLVAN